MGKPNILYVHSHDTGRYLQPYGYPVATPNLQRLAEEGVLFRQAFTVNPTCSASRACLLTGMDAHSNGMTGLAHRGFSLNDYGQHIIHTLKKSGYVSVLSGVQHIAGPGMIEKIGYDRVLDAAGAGGAELAARDYILAASGQPFFLSVGFFETHRKFPENEPADDPRYTLPAPFVPDTAETRKDMACFKTMARHLDRKVGVVLDALRERGIYENTLIISTTDHGIAFPRMKCNLHDAGIGVSLIMRGPGGFIGGQVVDALVSHLDVFPTVCEMIGIERPAWLQGYSILPLVNGKAEKIRDEIHAEVNYHASYEPMRAVRTERYKYIRRFDERTRPVLPNCDDSPSKTSWLAAGWRRYEREMLYDLTLDPNEMDNLAADPQYADVKGTMQKRLEKWMRATDDPLLNGRVPAPAGAVVNDADDLSPDAAPKPIKYANDKGQKNART